MTMTAQETADSLAEMTGSFERRRDAILAALLAERKAALADVRVKPLEWVKPPLADTLTKAETIVGAYAVWTHPEAGGRWFATLRGANNYLSYEASDEASCRAAAQADYEYRIRSALALSPEGKGPDDGWLPIDGAPKDKPVIVGGDGWVCEARFFEDEDGWWAANTDPTDSYNGQVYPTMFQHLPSPPTDHAPEEET